MAGGSLSLRKSPCIRDHCAACESGEGDPSFVLYTRSNGPRGALYMPDALAPDLQAALANGRVLHALIVEAGRRYLSARKAARVLATLDPASPALGRNLRKTLAMVCTGFLAVTATARSWNGALRRPA